MPSNFLSLDVEQGAWQNILMTRRTRGNEGLPLLVQITVWSKEELLEPVTIVERKRLDVVLSKVGDPATLAVWMELNAMSVW